MKRIKAATQANPKKVLMSVCAIAVASAIVVGSGANFTSTTANPGTTATAGNLTHSNSGGAIFTATLLRPGQTQSGTVDIANTGNIDGVFTLGKSNLVDTPGPGVGAASDFSAKLDLVVTDCGPVASANCATGTTRYTGKLGALNNVPLGTYAPAADHRYRFAVTFPNGLPAEDNPYKGASTSVQFDWQSVNN